MESTNQKWVNICYLVAAALLGYVVLTAGLKISAAVDLETRVRNAELIIRVVSVLAGAVLFGVLYKHPTANGFMNEVVDELSRVSWPTQKETTSATFIVLVMVLISGVVLGLVDTLLVYGIPKLIDGLGRAFH